MVQRNRPKKDGAGLFLGIDIGSTTIKAVLINGTVFGGFNGCIIYNHGFGRCSMSDSCFIKHLREEPAQVPVPLLQLDGDCVDPTIDPCSTCTKINAYVEGLNIQRFGNPFGAVDESLPASRNRKHLHELHDTSYRIIHFSREHSPESQENLS